MIDLNNIGKVVRSGGREIERIYAGDTMIWELDQPAIDYSTENFTLRALEDDVEIKFWRGSSSNTFYYKTEAMDDFQKVTTESIIFKFSEYLTMYGVNDGIGGDCHFSNPYPTVTSYRQRYFSVEGRLMTLFYRNNTLRRTLDFNSFFANCEGLVSAKNLVLPNYVQAECYMSMFWGCSNLLYGPELPATKLAFRCYHYMFNHCTSLLETPALSASTLADYCYDTMFGNCTSLSGDIMLPATNASNINRPYNEMFIGCNNINSITCLIHDGSALGFFFPTSSRPTNNGTLYVRNDSIYTKSEWQGFVGPNWTVEYIS